MMTYVFKCIKEFEYAEGMVLKEGEMIEVDLKPSEYDAYKAAHPELERYHDTAPGFRFADMVQPDGRFMERLDRIRHTYPGAKGMFEGSRFRPKREW